VSGQPETNHAAQATTRQGGGDVGDEPVQRAVPYLCPFCGEEDLRPEPEGRWHCRSCLRLFSVAFFGLKRPPQ
jgi:ribosomal protein L37AE/L43A